jgi:hypothetical protein
VNNFAAATSAALGSEWPAGFISCIRIGFPAPAGQVCESRLGGIASTTLSLLTARRAGLTL